MAGTAGRSGEMRWGVQERPGASSSEEHRPKRHGEEKNELAGRPGGSFYDENHFYFPAPAAYIEDDFLLVLKQGQQSHGLIGRGDGLAVYGLDHVEI